MHLYFFMMEGIERGDACVIVMIEGRGSEDASIIMWRWGRIHISLL